MPRDSESLIDIQAAIRRILRYTHGIDRIELEVNDEKLSAILYQITIIGEAARRISEPAPRARLSQPIAHPEPPQERSHICTP